MKTVEDLPEETYRVFPEASYPARNSYGSKESVGRAIGQRLAKRRAWRRRGEYYSIATPEEIQVFKAVTVWVDVTEEFVK